MSPTIIERPRRRPAPRVSVLRADLRRHRALEHWGRLAALALGAGLAALALGAALGLVVARGWVGG